MNLSGNSVATLVCLLGTYITSLSPVSDACRLDIRSHTIADAWQSSSFLAGSKLLCFKNTSSSPGWNFFLSNADTASENNGFHWFVVKLKPPTLITSVVVTSRDQKYINNPSENVYRNIRSRSADIEIWTSPSDSLSLGSDHCSSRDISSQFDAESGKWRFCGRTAGVDAVQLDQQLLVNCTDLYSSRYMLLRKFVGNLTADKKFMGFSDLWINAIETQGRMHIWPSTIADSWQSSYYSKCFKSGSGGLTGPSNDTYEYFHTSKNGSDADAGFQWFVVKLKETALISSVFIKNRGIHNYDERSKELLLRSRSADIEIWVSQTDNINFGTDHCSSRNISSQFNDKWKQCGSTPPISGIVSGEIVTVMCKHPILARYLLLRKPINNANLSMSFVNMWINKPEAKGQLYPPGPLKQNSTLKLNCSMNCGHGGLMPSYLKLCHPNGQCYPTWETQIDSLQPSDSGIFTCQSGGHIVSSMTVSVMYPPNQLRISESVVSSGTDNTANDANFKFESSAAHPVPVHWCTATASVGDVAVMKHVSDESASNGEMRSYWQCVNCSRSSGRVTLNCGSYQQGFWNVTTQLTWQYSDIQEILGRYVIVTIISITAIAVAVAALLSCFKAIRRRSTGSERQNQSSGTGEPVAMAVISKPDASMEYEYEAITDTIYMN